MQNHTMSTAPSWHVFLYNTCAMGIFSHLMIAALASAGLPPAGTKPVITNTSDLFALSDDEVARGRAFELSGTLTYYIKPCFILDDGNGRIPIFFKGMPNGLAVGDCVKVSAGTCQLDGAGIRMFLASVFQTTGKVRLPPPKEALITDLDKPAFAFATVRVRGRVNEVFTDEIAPNYIYLTLVPETAESGSFVLCATRADRLDGIQEDAIVQISGLYMPWMTSLRRYGGPLLCFHKEDREIISLPVPIPDAPDFSTQAFVSPSKILSLGKRRLDGMVLASWGGNQILLRSASRKVHRVELSIGQPLPRYGDNVVAIGNPETDLYHLNLSHAVCRMKEGGSNSVSRITATPVTPEDILDNEKGEREIQPSYSGQLIQIRGRVTLPQTIVCDTSHLYLNCGRHIVPMDISALGDTRLDAPPDSLVEATGICVLDIDNWRPNSEIPKIKGFTVIVRSPGDIRIVAKPPWWTPARLAAIIVMMLVVLAAILVWNRTLKFLVDLRTRQLLREQISHATTILESGERTWLAVELHDSLSQNLAGIACQIEAMRCALDTNPESVPEHLTVTKQMLLSCRTELKRCLFDLRSHALEENDFNDAIRTTLCPIIGRATLSIRFNVLRQRLLDTSAHAILYIIRELVSNAISHGQATQISVSGDLKDETLLFSVQDNGTGFDPANVAGPLEGHFGLQGIRDRLERLRGEMKIESAPGKGTKVFVTINHRKES